MQELKKKRRKRPKNELDRGAQKEQKNLTDITEEQLKVNIGIVRLGNMIKFTAKPAMKRGVKMGSLGLSGWTVFDFADA